MKLRPIWVVAAVVLLLVCWQIVADRITPYTDNVRVQAFVVPIVPQVSGYVSELGVVDNTLVEPGDMLARIDPRPYELAVQAAQAELELAGQDIAADTAGIDAAQANLTQAQSELANSRLQGERVLELAADGFAPQAKADDAIAEIEQLEARVRSAEAELQAQREALGDSGSNNPRIQAALAALGQARLELSWTELVAPSAGLVSDLAIAQGNYASPGQPLMTLIAVHDVWVEAYMTENNLGNIRPGQPVEIAFDIAPGRILQGEVISTSYGVSAGRSSQLGDLSASQDSGGWLRDPQRFPVLIKLVNHEYDGSLGLRVNGQADVIIYTGHGWVFNTLGKLWIRLNSILSYAY